MDIREAANNMTDDPNDDEIITGSPGNPRIIYYAFPQDLTREALRERREHTGLGEPEVARLYERFELPEEAVRDAMDSIEAAANIRFVRAPSGTEPDVVFWNHDVGMDYQNIGVYSGSRGRGDITIRRDLAETHWRSTIIHELGHMLNMKHSSEQGAYRYRPFEPPYDASIESLRIPNSASQPLPSEYDNMDFTIMSYEDGEHNRRQSIEGLHQLTGIWESGRYRTDIQTPMLGDIMWLQQAYGANPNTGLGNTVYTLNDRSGAAYTPVVIDREYARAIIDNGGRDTLDASANAESVTLRLNPDFRRPSIVGSQNVFIAYGTVIERAVGGSASDVLSTHARGDSVLEGRGGIDNYYINGNNNVIRDNGESRVTFFNGSGVTIEDSDATSQDRLRLATNFNINRATHRYHDDGSVTVTFYGANTGESASIRLPASSREVNLGHVEVDDAGLLNRNFTIPPRSRTQERE